eukprot:m.10672 g.10672  ORF g.10672 m.10672 type:complete len:345 (+) comp3707_c0_seq1:62-1096(+)
MNSNMKLQSTPDKENMRTNAYFSNGFAKEIHSEEDCKLFTSFINESVHHIALHSNNSSRIQNDEQLQSLKKKLSEVTREAYDNEKKRQELEEELTKAKEMLVKASAEVGELKTKIRNMKRSLEGKQGLEEDLVAAKKRCEEMEKDIRILEREKGRYKLIEDEHKQLTKEVENLNTTLTTSRRNHFSAESTTESLRMRVARLEKDSTRQEELSRREQIMNAEKITVMERKAKSLQEELVSEQRRGKQLSTQVDAMEREKIAHNDNIVRLREELKEKETELLSNTKNIKDTEKSHASTCKKLVKRNANLASNNQNLKITIAALCGLVFALMCDSTFLRALLTQRGN